jgi:hypothetical protein
LQLFLHHGAAYQFDALAKIVLDRAERRQHADNPFEGSTVTFFKRM